MNIKHKEPIQAALDSLEMALEHLEDQEEYTLNDVSIKDLWDIWEEASHQLGMANMDVSETSMMKEELKHFADGFHEGEWERDVEVPRPWPGLDQILKDMDIPKEWESVKTLTWDEFTKKYGNIKSEVNQGGGYTTHTPEWIYESPDGKIIYRRREGNDKRQLLYKHPQYGPPYTMTDMSGHDEWIDEDEAKKRHWYNDYVKGKKK